MMQTRLLALLPLIVVACRQSESGSRADSSSPADSIRAAKVSPASGPSITSLDPQIVYVGTGGSWQLGERSGEYRVVVRNSGFEHISSLVTVDWLEADPDSGVFVRASRTLDAVPKGVYSIGLPTIEKTAGRTELTFSGTHTYELSERSWRFALGEPNVIRVISDSTR